MDKRRCSYCGGPNGDHLGADGLYYCDGCLACISDRSLAARTLRAFSAAVPFVIVALLLGALYVVSEP